MAVVEILELTNLLLTPLKLVANTLQNIADVEESGPFLQAKVVTIELALKKIGSGGTMDREKWQKLMPDDEWNSMATVLVEVASKLETAGELLKKKAKLAGRLSMWTHAKRLKASLDQSHNELDGVVNVLTSLQVSLFGEDSAIAASNTSVIRAQLDKLMQLVREGQSVEHEPAKLVRWPSMAKELRIRYNKKKLEFLQEQMAPLKDLDPCPPAECSSIEAWKESMKDLKKTMECAEKLISRHRCRFSLQTFYSAAYAKRKVEMICGIFKYFVNQYGSVMKELEGVQIQDKIPKEAVDDDRVDLCKKLKFVLFREEVNNIHESLREEWEGVREEHEDRVKRLDIINEDKIEWNKAISEDTYEVTYYKTKATAKRMIHKGESVELEEFAKFFTEVAIMGSLNITNVARLIGVSLKGLLVVERGEKSLMEWYKDHQEPIQWSVKVKVLWEAAIGLLFVHENHVIHRFVNSYSFLMFPGNSVRITNFSSATAITEVRSLSHRRQMGLSLWIAPEIFDGQPHSLKSDVFSFGVVMHEVAAQRHPYGLNATEASVWSKKKCGKMPCRVPDDCPGELQDLMRQCCSVRPGARPTMEEVADCLEKISDSFDE